MASDIEPSSPDDVQNATKTKQRRVPSRPASYDAVWTNPPGRLTADARSMKENRLHATKPIKIGTWNGRGMDL